MIVGSLSISLHYKFFTQGVLSYFRNKRFKLAFLLISVPTIYNGFLSIFFPRKLLFNIKSYRCFKNVPSPHPISIIGFLNLIDCICNTSNVLQKAVSGLTQYRFRKFRNTSDE